MRIQFGDLDPLIARRLQDLLPDNLKDSPDPLHDILRLDKRSVDVLSLLIVVLGVLLAGYLLFTLKPPINFLVVPGVFLTLFVGIFPVFGRLIGRFRRECRNAFQIPGWRYLLTSTSEFAYMNIVLELQKVRGQAEETAARGLLNQVTGLLQLARHLEQRRDEGRRAINEKPLDQLEAEQEDFLRRAAETSDPEARQKFLQNAELCGGQMENVRALAALDSRLGVQLVGIEQILAAVHDSCARMWYGTAEGTGGALVEKMAETCTEIQGKTRAVEQAVEEVMQRRAG